MDHYDRTTPAPAFDSDGIKRRTRRRRITIALTSGAAALAVAAGLVATLDTSSSKPAVVADAPSSMPASTGVVPGAPSLELPQSDVPGSASPSDDALKTATVPDLVGMNRATATRALAAAGLNVAVGDISESSSRNFILAYDPSHKNLIGPNDLIAPGLVTMVLPQAGTRVEPGSYVTLMLVHL